MVKTLFTSAFREIRQSLGRYLAILAIIGLGVGFFAGLRMCQPSMLATGAAYLTEQQFFDFQLLSTLGFTEEDVAAFAGLDGISAAEGAVYTDFLMDWEDKELVFTARSITSDVNILQLTAGEMPRSPYECLGDARFFSEEDLGQALPVSPHNDEDTRELLAYDSYTLVGIVQSPAYLNHERGTSTIGGGSLSGFLYIPLEGFEYEAFYEVYLTSRDRAAPYSDEYDAQIEALTPQVEDLTDLRATLRYDTLYGDALAEIEDAAKELEDGWKEYYQEWEDVNAELADAKQELEDGEVAYQDGLEQLAQGREDYRQGLAEIEDGERTLADAKKELDENGPVLDEAAAALASGRAELDAAKAQLDASGAELDAAAAELETGETSYKSLSALYDSAKQLAGAVGLDTPAQLIATLQSGQAPPINAAVDAALQAQGSNAEAFVENWTAAETGIGTPLDETYLAGLRASLDQGQVQMQEGRSQYEAGLAEYETGRAAFEAREAEYQEGRMAYEKGREEYESGAASLRKARQELDDAAEEIAKAEQELDDARQELDDGWREYNDGMAEAEKEFSDARQELEDGDAELQDAKEELAKLETPDTYVLTRSENTGYICFENDISIVAAVSLVFPVFFFLVAALVCMTTMTRMVDEERTQIGVLKALGYSNGQIMGKYLFYSGSAAVIGSVAGYALGVWILPWIVWEIYAIMYGFAPLEHSSDPVLAAMSFVAAILCSVGATWMACRVELRQPAAELIRPKSPKAGRRVLLERIRPLWRRLGFLQKVSLRNVFRYRSRLVMMVLGIGGCTALLVTGFGLQDSVRSVLDRQYEEITHYDYAVSFQKGQTADSAAAYLAGRGWEEGLLIHQGSVDVMAGGRSKSVYLVVPQAGDLGNYISLHTKNMPVPFPGSGEAAINTALARELGVAAGDTLALRSEDLGAMTVKVSTVFDNYVGNYVYLSPATCIEQTGKEPEYTTLYLHSHEGADPFQEGALLSDGEGVSQVTVNQSMRNQVDNMLSRMDYIVIVVVICAGALAFIVLYNLTNINITERIREIATIKVLGFYQGEVAAYVFREIGVLSVLGSLVGLLLGKALHAFVMAQVRIDAMSFPVLIYPSSYAISFGLTMLFTIFIALAMGPRLRKVDMAESLKSVE